MGRTIMSFNVGDTVIKPGLGICKIKAIRKMQVEGKDQTFYVLQSGDVKVMVPFSYAHAGGLRPLLNEEGIEKLFLFLREPIMIPEDERESPDHYSLNVEEAKEQVKLRDPLTLASLVKTLFFKTKIVDLPKVETDIYQNSMQALSDEIAHIEHTTRQKAAHRIRSTLTEARKARRDAHL
jgi:CarD family transcriptional regulator